MMQNVSDTKNEVCCFGDFNTDWLSDSYAEKETL